MHRFTSNMFTSGACVRIGAQATVVRVDVYIML